MKNWFFLLSLSLITSCTSSNSSYEATQRATQPINIIRAHCENLTILQTPRRQVIYQPNYQATVSGNNGQSFDVTIQQQNSVAQGGAELGAAIRSRIVQQRIFNNCMIINGYKKLEKENDS